MHVDILFTATSIAMLLQILFQTGGQIGFKAMPGILSPPGFVLFFFIPLSVHMVRPTNPAHGYETTETIFEKGRAFVLQRGASFFFVDGKLKFDLFLRRLCARDACVPCAKGLSRDT